MKKIIISPYAQKLRKKNPTDPEKINPKNYPYWKEVVNMLRFKGYYIIQIGVNGEANVGANELKFNLSLVELRELLNDADCWISVDSFFSTLLHTTKRGALLYSVNLIRIFLVMIKM
jgi:ADP-heptose:LPS heptosyltransferase